MMMQQILEKTIRRGQLKLIMPDGSEHSFGEGSPEVVCRINNPKVPARLFRDGDYEFGQTYMEKGWDLLKGDPIDLLNLFYINWGENSPGLLKKFVGRTLKQWNHLSKSLNNVSRHYDLDEKLFRAFLDKDMHYSCAYYKSSDADLETAQQDKCRHIMNKLLLQPGQSLLDIGCGWGSLAMYLAQQGQVHARGITLSKEQLRVAKARADERGIAGQVSFDLEDYRKHQGHYDRIVSVGMFEHVGRPYYETFFRQISRLLKEDGVALLHTIGRTGKPSITNPWIEKHIFPGGYIPALSEVITAIERSGLLINDVEILRFHYAETLAAWAKRFKAHRAAIVAGKGETFCRMWELYLAMSESAFRYSDLVVYQVQLSQSKYVVPDTRDYLYR